MSVRRKHGEVREDGMVFWHYHPNGSEYWVDKTQYEAMQLRRTNRAKKYHLANRIKISERKKLWKKLNRDKILERQKIYRLKNRKRLTAQDTANKRNRRQTEPILRLTDALRGRLRHAFKAQSVEKCQSTFKLTGCSKEELRKHLLSQLRDGMTFENYGRVWHIDHIRPCASFDLSDPSQAVACFHYSNLQPLFARENLIKSDNY